VGLNLPAHVNRRRRGPANVQQHERGTDGHDEGGYVLVGACVDDVEARPLQKDGARRAARRPRARIEDGPSHDEAVMATSVVHPMDADGAGTE
jgi:hypothetical protein